MSEPVARVGKVGRGQVARTQGYGGATSFLPQNLTEAGPPLLEKKNNGSVSLRHVGWTRGERRLEGEHFRGPGASGVS